MTAIEVASANSAVKLQFSNFDGSHFTVAVTGSALNASVRVYVGPDLGPRNIAALLDVFKAMAENWKGCAGELSWGSLEGEFEIISTSDSLVHATLRLMFREYEGPAPWSAEIDFTLESMQIEKAHMQLTQFFA